MRVQKDKGGAFFLNDVTNTTLQNTTVVNNSAVRTGGLPPR